MNPNTRFAMVLFLAALTPLSARAGAQVVVVNSSSWTIVNMYLSPTSEGSWGHDRLGTTVLGTGNTLTLSDIACNVYDVRIVDEDGDECIVKAIPMCEGSETWNIDNSALLGCQAETRGAATSSGSTVHVTNSSLWSIDNLFISPTSQSSWGPDQLGSEIIGSGGSFTMSGIPCGSYDVKLVDEDGDVCVVSGVSLCGETASWDITSDALLGCQSGM